VAVGTEGAQDVLRRADKETAQIAITGLGNPQLRITIAGLISLGNQPEGGTNLPAPGETLWILKREHECQGGKGPTPAMLCRWRVSG